MLSGQGSSQNDVLQNPGIIYKITNGISNIVPAQFDQNAR